MRLIFEKLYKSNTYMHHRLLVLIVVFGCSDDTAPSDAGVDARVDAAVDATADVFGLDVGTDAGFDAEFTRADARVDLPLDDVLRLNHLQVEGTHNSYHVQPRADIPDWRYTHAPLDEQLESQGVRAFELDTYFDADLGVWEVFHIATLDEETTCATLLECLAAIRHWSDAHVNHHPIFIQIEPKDFFDEANNDDVMAAMEDEIRFVFPEELIVTPDFVRGEGASLREVVTTTGWPTLGEVRGRVLFFLNCAREWCVHYANRGTGLEGRLIFADANADDPWAAVRILNGGGAAARAAVEAGFIVRSRAISMPAALEQTGEQLDTELASVLATGAHIVSTDVPIAREDVARFVEMPGGNPSRCNPVTAPVECTAAALEDL